MPEKGKVILIGKGSKIRMAVVSGLPILWQGLGMTCAPLLIPILQFIPDLMSKICEKNQFTNLSMDSIVSS
jgi:hypothetical protein